MARKIRLKPLGEQLVLEGGELGLDVNEGDLLHGGSL